jgi:hypothetical protein
MSSMPQTPDNAPPSYSFDIPLAAVKSAPIAEFDRYWNGKRRDGRLPGRADIDPSELRTLLPNMVLLDIEPAPFRARIRLVGTRIVQFRGDNTGKYLDELASMERRRRNDYIAEMRTVAARKSPAFACDAVTTRFGASSSSRTTASSASGSSAPTRTCSAHRAARPSRAINPAARRRARRRQARPRAGKARRWCRNRPYG